MTDTIGVNADLRVICQRCQCTFPEGIVPKVYYKKNYCSKCLEDIKREKAEKKEKADQQNIQEDATQKKETVKKSKRKKKTEKETPVLQLENSDEVENTSEPENIVEVETTIGTEEQETKTEIVESTKPEWLVKSEDAAKIEEDQPETDNRDNLFNLTEETEQKDETQELPTTNKKAAKCSYCGKLLPIGTGIAIGLSKRYYCVSCKKTKEEEAYYRKQINDILYDHFGGKVNGCNMAIVSRQVNTLMSEYDLSLSQILYILKYIRDYTEEGLSFLKNEYYVNFIIKYYRQALNFWKQVREARVTPEKVKEVLTMPKVVITLNRSDLNKRDEYSRLKRLQQEYGIQNDYCEIEDDENFEEEDYEGKSIHEQFYENYANKQSNGGDEMCLNFLEEDIDEITDEDIVSWEE